MPLTPQDIVRKEFREALRGYNQADVDLFLDEVVEEFTRLSEENQRMKVRIAALQQEIARYRDGGAPAPASGGGGERLEAEVRGRLKRFLEEQLRLVEAGATASTGPGSTAERMAREMAPPPPPRESERAGEAADEAREPFWAGE